VGPTKHIEGDYYVRPFSALSPTLTDEQEQTVNPCAINEDLDVFTKNRRDGASSSLLSLSVLTSMVVTILSMDSQGSTPVGVAVVAVGAMLVGSIIQTKEQGSTVHRGEELGYFGESASRIILYSIDQGRSVRWIHCDPRLPSR
jgi:hypothetical protein